MRTQCYIFTLAAFILMAFSGCGRDEDGRTFETRLRINNQAGEPRIVFSSGEPIFFAFSVTNLTDNPQKLSVLSPQTYDVIVADRLSSRVVWHWSVEGSFSDVLEELPFAPGETKTFFPDPWGQLDDTNNLIPPRDYIAQGFMLTLEEIYSIGDVIAFETETRSPGMDFSIR